MNPMQFMQQLMQFGRSFQGDPEAEVKKLVQSGQMSQQTYAQYSRVAEMFSSGNQQEAMQKIFGNDQ